MNLPRIIPVVDVFFGQVVRALGGRRDEYRPIVSRITSSIVPVEVARDVLKASRSRELYVADLDAIRRTRLGAGRVDALLESVEVPVWLDCGIRTLEDLAGLDRWPSVRPIVSFESLESMDLLSDRVIFSLDLMNGELMGDWERWGVADARDICGIVKRVLDRGVRTLIVLDLAAIGKTAGPSTLELCARIREHAPEIELVTGGGIRNDADRAALGAVGVNGVLIASALHDGVHFTTETSA